MQELNPESTKQIYSLNMVMKTLSYITGSEESQFKQLDKLVQQSQNELKDQDLADVVKNN